MFKAKTAYFLQRKSNAALEGLTCTMLKGDLFRSAFAIITLIRGPRASQNFSCEQRYDLDDLTVRFCSFFAFTLCTHSRVVVFSHFLLQQVKSGTLLVNSGSSCDGVSAESYIHLFQE